MALISWTGSTSGSWTTAGSWSGGVAPQRGDDVAILTPTALTVTYSTGTLFLNSLATGVATLSITGGTLGVANGYDFGGALTISAGLLRLVGGTSGNVFASNVTQSGGTITLLNNAIAQGGTFTQNAGTLTIGNGSFTDHDGGTFAGAIKGAGQMIFASTGATINLASGVSLATNSALVQSGSVALGGKLTYGGNFTVGAGGTLALNGNTLTLAGVGALGGLVTSGGVLIASGTGHLNGLTLDNGVQLSITGTYNQTGSVTVGQSGSGTLVIGAQGGTGGALRLTNNAVILSGGGGGSLYNYGLLSKVGGGSSGGTSTIYTAFTNASSATVAVNIGVLDFRGPSSGFTSTLAGHITGAGTVAFDTGNFAVSSASSLTLDVARVAIGGSANVTLTTVLSYAGNWDQTGGTLVVGSPSQATPGTLALTGLAAFDGGLLKGTGTVLSTGAVNLGSGMDLEGNLTFNFSGPVSQTGIINLGLLADAITIAQVTAGDTWALKGNAGINGFNGDIQNAGTFEKLNGAGNSVVQSGLFNTGTVAVNTGTLTLSGVGSLGGSVTGAAVLDISGAYQFASGLALSVGELILDNPNQFGEVQAALNSDLAYANRFALEGGTVSLNGHTLSLTGIASLQSGAIQGTGQLTASGPTILGQGLSLLQGAKLQLNGTTEQTGNVVLSGGSSAPTLAIGPAGTYTMDAGVHLGGVSDSVVGTVTVGGTLFASGVGISPSPANVIAAALVDNGKIVLQYGEMQFLGPLTGKGATTLSNGATLDLLGSGTVSNGITFGTGGGVLSLGSQENFTGTITSFTAGDMIELQGVAYIANPIVVSGNTVTVDEGGKNVTFTFDTAQTASSLIIGEGPHGGLALIHI